MPCSLVEGFGGTCWFHLQGIYVPWWCRQQDLLKHLHIFICKLHSPCYKNSDLTCFEDFTAFPTIFNIIWIYGIGWCTDYEWCTAISSVLNPVFSYNRHFTKLPCTFQVSLIQCGFHSDILFSGAFKLLHETAGILWYFRWYHSQTLCHPLKNSEQNRNIWWALHVPEVYHE